MSDSALSADELGSPDTSEARDDFLVVGLGASAGGIGAFKEFFNHVQVPSGIAYVAILHLSPDHDSKLAEVLQSSTAMPVRQVADAEKVEPDCVYVIPPNKSLSIADGTLRLSPLSTAKERRSPVDLFFRTLADAKESRAICVVLSGTGADGSNGLKRVKEKDGVAIAQTPEEAEYDDMPRHAIATGLVDCVLPVSQIPAAIRGFRDTYRVPKVTAGVPNVGVMEEQARREIFASLRSRTGHDFSNYKSATMLRRISRRAGLRQLPDFTSYARYLREHPSEGEALLRDLLVSVTQFFRDPEAFAALARLVIPLVFADKRAADQVRVWVPACATGEEAYSIAMLLAEHAQAMPEPPSVQVFASDLDVKAIERARDARYTDADLADVPAERVRRFFVRDGDDYRVKRELREIVLFAHHNLIKDPPFSHLDLICCRNLLIYLNRSAQEQVMQILHFALRPNGYLFLGASESVEGTDLFSTIDKDARIYQGRTVASRLALTLPPTGPIKADFRRFDTMLREPAIVDRHSYADLHHRLLEQYGPPSVLVNEEHHVVHLSEHAGRYLRLQGGEPTHNLLKILLPELRHEVRIALFQAAKERTSVEARGVLVNLPDADQRIVDVIVRPVLRDGDPARGFFVVTFDDRGERPPMVDAPEPVHTGGVATRQLEDELLRVKDHLRNTVEQYETQTEELKASNEELQAINEELRSSAEELETSKEELQSVNEELSTVNQELKIKIDELSQTNNDFQNLINSTDIATIFLDASLRVKFFTPNASEVFNLIAGDAGRRLSDITSKLVYDGLSADVEQVMKKLSIIEREMETRNGRWCLMRMLPYRTTEDRIQGLVMTFIDITDRRNAELRLRASEERLRLLIESARDYAIFTVDESNIIDSWNPGAQNLFGYTEAEILGQSASILFTPEDRAHGVPEQERRQAREEGRAEDERWHLRKDGSRVYCSGVMTPLRDGEPRGFAKIARDLSGQKHSQSELQRAQDRAEVEILERTRDLREQVAERTDAEERSRALLRKLVTAQEDERRRIARDLHDQLGQQLTSLRLKLAQHAERVSQPPLRDELEEIQGIAKEIDAEVDFLAWQLRPAVLDDLGLVAALANYLRQWAKHYDIRAEFHTSGFERTRLAPETETNLYRMAQEALNNVAKHAQASRVDVILETREGSAVLIVEDDGTGFDQVEVESSGTAIGLAGIIERAALIGGSAEIESTPGDGTTVFARVPFRRLKD